MRPGNLPRAKSASCYAFRMLLPFTKMHGLGNDFIVLEVRNEADVPDPATLRRLADRHTGIGFDQALIIHPPRHSGTDVFYRNFNADGSEVEQCGNGARCVASLVAHQRGAERLTMENIAGIVHAQLLADGRVSIDMGVPDFTPSALPFSADRQDLAYDIEVNGAQQSIGAVSMGNPHAVLTVADVLTAPVETLGPALESHSRFPRRVNVGFMQIVSPSHIRLRVYERGVGETRACGTGACAAVAVGRLRGVLTERVRVDMPGGELQIDWAGAGQPLWMTGPTAHVFDGRVEI